MKNNRLGLRCPLRNESGSVIIAAIFILVLVTILGVVATNTTTLELEIAANDQFMKMAFYNSDSALYGTSKLISHAVNRSEGLAAGGTDAPGIGYLSASADAADEFYRQVAGFDVYNDAKDIDFINGGIDADADAQRIRQGYADGTGSEFGTGSEGLGVQGIAIFYDINTSGFSNRQTTSNLTGAYRKLIGVPGGL